MVSIVFDKLWDETSEREGELMEHVFELRRIYKIPSAVDALRLARALEKSGQSFFEYCEAVYKANERYYLEKMKRRHRLTDYQMKLLHEYLEKTKKGL